MEWLRNFVHWNTEPASGKWLETSANTSATMNCPSATTGNVQMNAPPSVPIPRMNSVKMPVAGEM